MNGIVARIIASIVVFLMWAGVTFAFSLPATLATGQVAVSQFENSDQAYVVSQAIGRAFQGAGAIIILVFLLILLAIWWAPLRKLIARLAAAAAVLLALAPADRAGAYYDKTDFAELVYVLPSESAFFIPDVGA